MPIIKSNMTSSIYTYGYYNPKTEEQTFHQIDEFLIPQDSLLRIMQTGKNTIDGVTYTNDLILNTYYGIFRISLLSTMKRLYMS